MTDQKAKEMLEERFKFAIEHYKDECLEYANALEKGAIALERQIPKTPTIIEQRENEVSWKCPVCGLHVIEEPPCQNYCQNCGQKLDFYNQDLKE